MCFSLVLIRATEYGIKLKGNKRMELVKPRLKLCAIAGTMAKVSLLSKNKEHGHCIEQCPRVMPPEEVRSSEMTW
jgi:hypothetical protein